MGFGCVPDIALAIFSFPAFMCVQLKMIHAANIRLDLGYPASVEISLQTLTHGPIRDALSLRLDRCLSSPPARSGKVMS